MVCSFRTRPVEMKKQFCWNILAIILLCICLRIGVCDKNGQQHRGAVDRATFGAAGRSGKFRSTQGIPLRDDNDYIHRDADTETINDDEYDDEYDDEDDDDDDGDVGSNGGEAQTYEDNEDDENDSSPEIVEQAQSARTQIIQRPKELTEAELNALLKSSPTSTSSDIVDASGSGVVDSADATAPSSIETCPKECSCLNDFMTCTRPHLKHLPKVPHFIQSLYVRFFYIAVVVYTIFPFFLCSCFCFFLYSFSFFFFLLILCFVAV